MKTKEDLRQFMKKIGQNKVVSSIFMLVLALALLLGVMPKIYRTQASAAADFLNPDNWKNLPGYEFVSPELRADEGTKYPAEVTFGENVDGVGINMKVKGYYAGSTGDEDGNMYAGIVYKEKVTVENFSITFTVNKQGANSSASPADDGWIGIGFMAKSNLWHTTNARVNMGAVALCRTSSRGVNMPVHEVASDFNGYSIANFLRGTNVNAALESVLPAVEGATFRVSMLKESDVTGDKYFPKIEQIEFETKKVIAEKVAAAPLNCPELYLDAEGKAYLAISASTSNFDKQWDISIKNICGVDIGTAPDVAPLSPTERAKNIGSLIEKLQIYNCFELDGTLTEEGKSFYAPSGSVDVNTLSTELSVQLYNADAETLAALGNLDPASKEFPDLDAYLEFLRTCNEAMIDNYEYQRAVKIVSDMNGYLNELPSLEEVALTNEQQVFSLMKNIKSLYADFTTKAIELFGGQEAYENLWSQTITDYSAKLDEVSLQKYLSLATDLPVDISMDNAKTAAFIVVPAESLYSGIEQRLNDIRISDPEVYEALTAAKEKLDSARSVLDALKAEHQREIESYENGAKVRNEIFYLPFSVVASDAESVFGTLSRYIALSTELKNEIADDEKETLFNACASALEGLIAELPEASEITESNYITEGYDYKISPVNNYYNILEEVDYATAEALKGRDKLLSVVAKASAIGNPLQKKYVESKSVNAGETIEVAFADMFTNYFGRNYEITANYGSASKETEVFTVSFTEAGEYTVEVTIADSEYNQSAVCAFTVTVNGSSGQSGNDSGCGSTTAVSSLAAAFALLAVAVAVTKEKRCR